MLGEFDAPRARGDAALCAETRNALAALLDAAELGARLKERASWLRDNGIAGGAQLEMEIEAAERDMAREREERDNG